MATCPLGVLRGDLSCACSYINAALISLLSLKVLRHAGIVLRFGDVTPAEQGLKPRDFRVFLRVGELGRRRGGRGCGVGAGFPKALLAAMLKPSVTVKVYSTSTSRSKTSPVGFLISTCVTPFFFVTLA